MDNSKERKVTFMFLGIIFAFLLVIIILAIYFAYREGAFDDTKTFPGFKDANIDKGIFDDKEEYEDARDRLENDFYFSKVAKISDFNYRDFSNKDIKNMLIGYIYNYEILNDSYFLYSDTSDNVRCIQKKYVIDGFKELYNIDMSDDNLEFMSQFFEYMYVKGNRYCFYFDKVKNENEVKIGVERIALYGDEITSDIYIYEYYTNYLDNEITYLDKISEYINNGEYEAAKGVVVDRFNGKVTKKQVRFKIQKNAKFFKYKVLSIKTLNN